MFVGIGIGIARRRFAGGFAGSYSSRVIADGGTIEALDCVAAASSLLQSASLLIIPSGYKAGVVYAEIPASGNGDLTWFRNSSGSRTLSNGTIELPRTNYIINSIFAGAVAGTPGTLPTTYALFLNSGLSSSVVGTGIENGFNYLDIRIFGTSTTNYLNNLTISSLRPAVINQTWTHSIYIKDTTNNSPQFTLRQVEFDSGQNYLDEGGTANITPTSTLTRYTYTRTTTNANTAFIATSLYTVAQLGVSYDYIIRIAAPQMELSLVATEWIPTTNSVRTTFAGITQDGTSAANVPRLSYMFGSCPALLLEPQRTNSLRNSSMQGAVAGTPGTLPTNWVSQSTAGLTLQVASVGTQNGLDYVDIRYSGTATGTTIRLFWEANNQIVAADGQVWTSSFYTSISGSALPSTYRLGVQTNTIAGTSVSSIVATPNITQSTTLTRYDRVMTLPGGATVARAQPGIYVTIVNGQSYDFTIRIAAPQFEFGAYATTYINTTNAAATRLGDYFRRSNIRTNGLISASGGTWYVELRGNVSLIAESATSGFWLGTNLFTDNSNGTLYFRQGGGSQRTGIWKYEGGAGTSLYSTTSENVKLAIKWNGTTADIFANGTKVVSATSFTATNMEFLAIASAGIGRTFFIQAMALYSTPLSDADCTLITT